MLAQSTFTASLTTLVLCLHGCSGDAFTASAGAGGSSGGSGGTGGHGGVTVGTGGSGVGTGGSGVGGGSAGSSTGGQQATGGTGGVIAADSGAVRDAATDASDSGGSVGVDAGSPCGLTVGSASHTSASNQIQLAVAHTVLGLNRLLIVALAIRHDNGMPNTIPSPLTVTHGAVALTRLKITTDNYYQAAELWALVAPLPGPSQVIVKFASAPQQAALGVMSFTGAAQSATFGQAAAIASGGSSATLSVPSAGYAAVLDLLSHGGVQPWTAAAGQQELWRDGTDIVHGYSSFTRVGASVTGRSWSGPAAANYVLLGVPIAEVHCM